MCPNCNRKTGYDDDEYCWNCNVQQLKNEGATVIAPNNLPICCITAAGLLMENEYANHKDYKFPVEAEYTAAHKYQVPEWDGSYGNQVHALIYNDDSIALTLYEANYAIWSLRTGKCIGARYNDEHWKLTEVSISKIKEQK